MEDIRAGAQNARESCVHVRWCVAFLLLPGLLALPPSRGLLRLSSTPPAFSVAGGFASSPLILQ
jgi:hypothetical protein